MSKEKKVICKNCGMKYTDFVLKCLDCGGAEFKNNTEEIKLPHYEDMVVKAVHEMGIKFKNYGNDWTKSDDLYWKERILKECKEYNESMTIDSEKRKLLNILNMVAMAYDTVEIRGCRQHIADFGDIISSAACNVYVFCNVCNKPIVINNGIIREANKNVR